MKMAEIAIHKCFVSRNADVMLRAIKVLVRVRNMRLTVT